MAEHRQRPAEVAGRHESYEEGFEREEEQLAAEFRGVLRDLASELAHTVAEPSVGGVAEAVRRELTLIADGLKAELAHDLETMRSLQAELLAALRADFAALREQTTGRVDASFVEGFAGLKADLHDLADTRLTPLTRQLERAQSLEATLREVAAATGEATTAAAGAITAQVAELKQAGLNLQALIAATTADLATQATDLRSSVGVNLPALEAAARNMAAAQDNLRTMLRTYGESLERSMTALETKFAGLLAANLERAAQRQAELESRMRATAERTEESVVDLMHGNEAHHQAMIEGTAASLSQLEMFAQSQRRTASAVSGLFYLTTGSILGLVFLSYLLLSRG
jgi:hypothetical protein